MKKIVSFLIPLIVIFSTISLAQPFTEISPILIYSGIEYDNEIMLFATICGAILILIPFIKMLNFNYKASKDEEKLKSNFIVKWFLFTIFFQGVLYIPGILFNIIGIVILFIVLYLINELKNKKVEDFLKYKVEYSFIVDLLFFNVLGHFIIFLSRIIINCINYSMGAYGACESSFIELVFYCISLAFMIFPTLVVKSNLKKFDETSIDLQETKTELHNHYIKFLKMFAVLGWIGLAFKAMAAWSTPIGKPIIYLYPEKEEKVKVKLGKKENLTCTYPKYSDEWEVIAKPNGDLIDIKTGRNLYALYWEGINSEKCDFKDGFCVKGEDSIEFLEEKLALLGLNEREANEFIVYWLPRLESNNYNLIRFVCNEKMNEYMPLEINPKPDTVIRVMMQFKGVKNYQDIKEQELYGAERKGFTVVEWGGTEVK